MKYSPVPNFSNLDMFITETSIFLNPYFLSNLKVSLKVSTIIKFATNLPPGTNFSLDQSNISSSLLPVPPRKIASTCSSISIGA